MTALLREVIGDVLRRARIEQGRTLREVSDAARVSLGYLSEVERGRKEASSELLSAICGALEVPLSRVLTDAGQASMERRRSVSPGSRDATSGEHRRHHQGRHPAGRHDGGRIGAVALTSRHETRHEREFACRGVVGLRGTDKLAASANTGRSQARRAGIDTTRRRNEPMANPFTKAMEVPHGAVQLQGRRVRRPEGADPAGHRGRPASAPGADPAGRAGDRQPAPAGDAAEPSARRHREAAGQCPPGADAGRPGHRRG